MRAPLQFLCAMLFATGPTGLAGTDFAESRHADRWLRHPVYGDPSFDAFERVAGNPIHRGAPPYEWPVNGFLFRDPVSHHDYVFVGDYCQGYLPRPSRCRLYRSTDGMKSWADLGVVLQGDPAMFDKGGHTPDVSVVFDSGKYHMVYDWGEPNFNQEGGLAYAWAEKPEGPWHRAPEPITRNTMLSKMLGRYQRTYAGTLIRRKEDWLIVAMMDAAPNAWALFVMTAPTPAGPWSERRLVQHVEADRFLPPLMEFFPAFTHDGYLYAPATSVALNRNFNALFRAPLERAADPAAWSIARLGSLWHSEPTENEHHGIWGQTFSGSVDDRGWLWAMFPSRDEHGYGTVNLARRPWSRPLRPRGFVLSGHQGPSFTCLRQAFREFDLEVTLRRSGTAWLIWDWHGALGPNQPQSDATLHPLARTSCQALELSPNGWAVLRVDEAGQAHRQASGITPGLGACHLGLTRSAQNDLRLCAEGRTLWNGRVEGRPAVAYPGSIGLWVEPHSHLAVEKFRIEGHAYPARLSYLAVEALLGAGQNPEHWRELRTPEFRYGTGFVSRQAKARAKWNVVGSRLTLWCPCRPGLGQVEVRLDGKAVALLDLHADKPVVSQPLWTSKRLRGTYHSLVCEALTGELALDCLEVED